MSIATENRNRKLKSKFSKNVAKMRPHEIFGLKPCDGISWDKLFKDALILDFIRLDSGCNKTDIDCLIGKMSNNCNC